MFNAPTINPILAKFISNMYFGSKYIDKKLFGKIL